MCDYPAQDEVLAYRPKVLAANNKIHLRNYLTKKLTKMENVSRSAQLAKSERRSRRFWVSVICGFFAIDFSIAAIAISMAAGDPSFRSIPGYGERAVSWDVRQKRKQSSKELGWDIKLQRSEPLRDALELTIADEANKPVSGCSGTVRIFHYTRVATQLQAAWIEQEPGRYIAKVDVAKPGLWQLELELHKGPDQSFWSEQSLNWSDIASSNLIESK